MPHSQYRYDTNKSNNSYATNWKNTFNYSCGGACSCLPGQKDDSALLLLYPGLTSSDQIVEGFDPYPSMLKQPWGKSCPYQNTNACLGDGAANSGSCDKCSGGFLASLSKPSPSPSQRGQSPSPTRPPIGSSPSSRTPDYLSVPNFQNCLNQNDNGGYQTWCLGQNKPANCPQDSWNKLQASKSLKKCN